MVNPTNPAARTLSRDLEAAARTLGLELDVLHASMEQHLDEAFATLVQRRASALVIVADALFNMRSERLHRMWIDGTEFNWSTKKAAA